MDRGEWTRLLLFSGSQGGRDGSGSVCQATDPTPRGPGSKAPTPDENSCISETGRHAGTQAEQLPAQVCQAAEPRATAGSLWGHCHPHPGPRLRPHEASFLVVSGPRVPPWVKAADILFCLGPCPAPSTGDIVRLSLTGAGPGQQDFDPPSTPWGGRDSQPHFYQGQEALGKEPGVKRLLALPKGTQRELDLSPLTLTPRMPGPEEGQERE